MPDDATSWVVVRPRAAFEHPRLGRALARAFDDAGDRALVERARRVGYDVRTVERAAVAWTAATTWSGAVGPLDTRRIEALLWERLLPPRGRVERDGVIVVEGALGREPVSLAVWNECAFVTYAEGPSSARANALALRPRDAPGDDGEAVLRWHGRTVPAALRERAPEALLEGARDVEVTADARASGAAVTLRVEGSLPADAEARARRALDAFAESPLGESIGAPRWARSERGAIDVREGAIELRLEIPWAAVDAMADVLRGRVGEGPER